MAVTEGKWQIALVIIAVVVFEGCNKSSHQLAPVHGKVTIDGKPLTAGRLVFSPIAQGDPFHVGKASYGIIKSDGTYSLDAYGDHEGAIVGPHWVMVYNKLKSTTSAPQSWDWIKFPQKPVEIVANQDNEINIEITSQELSRFGVREK